MIVVVIVVVIVILIPLITGARMSTANKPMKHCNQFLKPYHQHQNHGNHGNDHGTDMISCLIMLNSSGMTARLVEPIWREFSMHVCADGGANRLFDTSSEQQREVLRPSAIVGDLDSLRYDVRSFYGSHGSHIIEDIDQDYNDVDKSLKYAKSYFDSNNTNHSNVVVVVAGAFGGRFDQEIASIHALYKWNSVFQRIVLMDGENIAMLLSPGKHELFPLQGIEGPTCGLLPVGGMVNSISTKGLKWNLDKHVLSIDGLVSSSNSIVGIDENDDGVTKYMVEVDTSDYIIWSCTVSVDK